MLWAVETKKDEGKVVWIKFHDYELYNLRSSPNIMGVIKSVRKG